MSSVLNTNMASLVAQKNLSRSQDMLATSIERLSSGLRINRAKDDAAGLAISDKLLSQIRSTDMAVRNAGDAISMVQTAEGALGEVSTMLQRMRELSTQGNNGSLTSEQRGFIGSEIRALRDEINKISERLDFNGRVLLNGSLQQDATSKSVTATPSFALNNKVSGVTVTGVSASTAAVDGTYTFGKILGAAPVNTITAGDPTNDFDATPATQVSGAVVANNADVGEYTFAYNADTNILTLRLDGQQHDTFNLATLDPLAGGTVSFADAGISFNVAGVQRATTDSIGANLASSSGFTVAPKVTLGLNALKLDADAAGPAGLVVPTEITGLAVAGGVAAGTYTFSYSANILTLTGGSGVVGTTNLDELFNAANGGAFDVDMGGFTFTVNPSAGSNADIMGANLAGETIVVGGTGGISAGAAGTAAVTNVAVAPTTAAGTYTLAYDSGTDTLTIADGSSNIVATTLLSTGFSGDGYTVTAGDFTFDVGSFADVDAAGADLNTKTLTVTSVPAFVDAASSLADAVGTGVETLDSSASARTLINDATVSAEGAVKLGDGSYKLTFDGTNLLTLSRVGSPDVELESVSLDGFNPEADGTITFGMAGLTINYKGMVPDSGVAGATATLAQLGANLAADFTFSIDEGEVAIAAGSLNGPLNAVPKTTVSAVNIDSAEAGAYTLGFDSVSNKLSLLRNGTTVGDVDLTGRNFASGDDVIEFAGADVSLTVTAAAGASVDSVGANLATMAFTVSNAQEQKLTLSREGGPTQVIDVSGIDASNPNAINFNLLGITLNATGDSTADILNGLNGQTLTVASTTTATVSGTTARVSTQPTLVTGATQANGTVVTGYSADSAGDGVYSLAFNSDSNVLTMTRTNNGTVSSQQLDLDTVITNPAATNTINFSALGVNFQVAGTSIDSIGADLASYAITKSSVVANGEASFQVGSSNGDTVDLSRLFVDIGIQSSGAFSGLNTSINNLTVGTPTVFGSLSDSVDAAIGQISVYRSDFGAMQNRLDYNISNLRTQSENLTASRSRIIDTDYAAETAQLTKTQIMQQAGTAMLAQANQLPNVILSLLR